MSNKLRRLQMVLAWVLDLEEGDNRSFSPLLPHEEEVDKTDLYTVCNEINSLHGKQVITYEGGKLIPYRGGKDVKKKEEKILITDEEAEAIQELFSEANAIVEDPAKHLLEDKTGANQLAKSIDDYEVAANAVQYDKPVIRSSLSFRFNDNGTLMVPDISLFKGGEVKLNTGYSSIGKWDVSVVSVYARLQDSDGIISLLMLKDALERALGAFNTVKYILYLDYVPYARQDRKCNDGEALSIKVMADLINTMEFDQVHITDPHSDVTPALINYCDMSSAAEVIMSFTPLLDAITSSRFDSIVSPDGGSIKKVEELAGILALPVIYAHKSRDLSTGNLSGFSYQGDVTNLNLLIVDDICDFGGTFVGLGEELRKGGALDLSLYVTHGIFSGGLDHLLAMFDTIYTTDSFISGHEHERLIVKQLYGK